ncbi:MAG: type II toxin-antitoxin system VapC family toxin [Actinomycetia bacterium]|nr:type II toxin-antitoxin system VapC family toxin [Actinomycetes bacterium]
MTAFLLDTNVVSELTKSPPAYGVMTFLSSQGDLWLSTVVVHELQFGVNLLPPGDRRDRISAVIAEFVAEYGDRILNVGRQEAEHAASLRTQAHRSGRVLHLADALIAGTAKAHSLSVATRNVSDFHGLAIQVTNPWTH